MKKVYQDGTNLFKVHNGNSFVNLHTCPKLELLQFATEVQNKETIDEARLKFNT